MCVNIGRLIQRHYGERVESSVDSTRATESYVDVSWAGGRVCCRGKRGCKQRAADRETKIQDRSDLMDLKYVQTRQFRRLVDSDCTQKCAAESISGQALWWLPSRSAPPILHLIASLCRCWQRILNPTRNRRRRSRCLS